MTLINLREQTRHNVDSTQFSDAITIHVIVTRSRQRQHNARLFARLNTWMI